MSTQKSNEIIIEMRQLFDKMAVDSVVPVVADTTTPEPDPEALLLNLKAINARYDKHEAIIHIKAILQRYNIQIDELLEQVIH